MKNLDEGVEVLDAEGLVWVLSLRLACDRIYQARSFSDLVVLDWLGVLSDGLDVHAD